MSTEPDATPIEGLGDTDELGAAWDKLTAEGVEEDIVEAPEVEAPQVEADATPEEADPVEDETPEPEPVEPPSHLPNRIKEHWASLSVEQREAIDATQREMSNRMAELGRVSQAAKPVYDVLLEAAKTLPSLRDMTPAQIARDTLQMATVQDALSRDPVGTIERIAREYGALDGLRAKLTGTEAQPAQNDAIKMRDLERRLEALTAPEAIEARVKAAVMSREVENAVVKFSETADHWKAVELEMPLFVQIAQGRLGEGASAQDVLSAAYKLATLERPDLQTKAPAPAPKAQVVADPVRTAAQVKAKSVNVVSKTNGAQKPLSEKQRMEAIWDKYHTA